MVAFSSIHPRWHWRKNQPHKWLLGPPNDDDSEAMNQAPRVHLTPAPCPVTWAVTWAQRLCLSVG
jgi:hypothetical protein